MKAGQAKVAVYLRFDTETYKKLEFAAKKLDLTVSALVTKLAVAHLNTISKEA